ncbi:MAG: hypothetical protein JRC86_06790 [Deltaproteobacteria bacterium]|nr:hypothetical protein [Deltaproteobacteria bacterium]
MATLLEGVNRVLKRVQIIDSDLASLTSSGKQPWINVATQVWNEVLIDLYDKTSIPYPKEVGTDAITLVTDDRSYVLASDLIQLRYPLKDEANGQFISEYPGGYMHMIQDQILIDNEIGLPYLAAFDPENGELYLDKIPTSNENGLVYKYWYDKNLEMTLAADVFPFNNHVYLSIIPAVAELWRQETQNKYDEKLYKKSIARAGSFLTQVQQNDSWLPVKFFNRTNNDPYAR